MIRKLTITVIAIVPLMFANFVYAYDGDNTEQDSAVSLPQIGQPAPEFTAIDTNGNEVSLDKLKGKVVVLEWTNHECPFVIKHYATNNMQSLQEKASEMGVIWISVASSATGKQGATTAEEANILVEEKGIKAAHRILDPEGAVGHLYGAKTTPHMFVIDAKGSLAYQGAIDDNPSPRQSAVEGARNYVLEAMTALTAGEKIEVAETRSYGCSVKY